ncbi:sulfatase-like hydrolase/transferase [Thalassoglobus sp. JC818]|uniref:sulfatase-like hydrolase/transferase n=1 Tax=Thalassoglobus sp. JC818 TaxID=3232136 RepID=UPI00345A4524
MRYSFLLALLIAIPSLQAEERPNVLFVISDDQSWLHASAYGCEFVQTPAFDRVASEGILFNNAFAASPGCSPCRAALLTGRHIWQIENAGTHASSFPAKYPTFPEVLAENGYHVGYTGKGWGPGNYKDDGRTENPAGPAYVGETLESPYKGISNKNYSANFKNFLGQKQPDQPFCFWYGAHEPHRSFEKGSGLKAGKDLEKVEVPPFLPDHPEIRSDLADYAVEIEWFDHHLGEILNELEAADELENTLIIVTSDNGMAFPRAKANCYEYGIHMPLAIRWGGINSESHLSDALVAFVDLTATIYDVVGIPHPSTEYPLSGHSLLPLLKGDEDDSTDRAFVFSGRERHSSSRYQTLAYPQRAMRTAQYLYIRNFRPERWPAGAPQKLNNDGTLGPEHGGYHDIDACPSLSFLIEHRDDPEVEEYFHYAVDMRPEIEIFDIVSDPGCLTNLTGEPEFAGTEEQLAKQFNQYLIETGDPRVLDGGDIFETYRRYSSLRSFPVPEHVAQHREEMEQDGWIPLFNGRDLEGWTASPPADSFTVVNGMIRAHATQDQSHLFYTGDVEAADFNDFELLVEGLTTPGSNGGVYFHTKFQEEGFPNAGHEVQMNASHKNTTRTGSLFAVQNLDEPPVGDDVFFTLHIQVQGDTVQIQVDDEIVVEYTEPEEYQHPRYTERRIDHGTFALQAHDPESIVYFREIWVRPLD